jgi:hypothetical protein
MNRIGDEEHLRRLVREFHSLSLRREQQQPSRGQIRRGKKTRSAPRTHSAALVTNVAAAPVGLKMTRMRGCGALRCAIAQHRQFRPVLVACGLGPGRLCSGIGRMWARSRRASMLRPGERAATIRCDLGFRTVSSSREKQMEKGTFLNISVDRIARTRTAVGIGAERRAERHAFRRGGQRCRSSRGLEDEPNKSIDAVRRAAGPHRRVQPLLSGCWLGSRRISPNIDQLSVRSRSDATLRGELPTPDAVRESRSCHRHGQPVRLTRCRTPRRSPIQQLGSGGRKETAQQSFPSEPLHPLMPALGVAIQLLEDPGQFCRDRGLSLAKEPTGIVDQLHSLPKNRRQPPRRHSQVPRAILCGCCPLPRVRTPCERSASRSGTNGSGTYQPIELERSRSEISRGGYE